MGIKKRKFSSAGLSCSTATACGLRLVGKYTLEFYRLLPPKKFSSDRMREVVGGENQKFLLSREILLSLVEK